MKDLVCWIDLATGRRRSRGLRKLRPESLDIRLVGIHSESGEFCKSSRLWKGTRLATVRRHRSASQFKCSSSLPLGVIQSACSIVRAMLAWICSSAIAVAAGGSTMPEWVGILQTGPNVVQIERAYHTGGKDTGHYLEMACSLCALGEDRIEVVGP